MRIIKSLAFATLLSFQAYAQDKAPANWFNLDLKNDKVWGMSTEKAYKELPLGKNDKKVIVAVIDAGTDVKHEDLKMNLWVNTKEIPENGIDDDNNGYIDDINGWSFIGGAAGDVKEDTYEYTRILASYIKKGYAENETPKFANDKEKEMYEQALELYKKNFEENNEQYQNFLKFMKGIEDLVEKTGSKSPSAEQVEALVVTTDAEKNSKKILKLIVMTGGMISSPIMASLNEAKEQLGTMVEFNLNKNFDPRNLVGDNYEDLSERFYGNNHIYAPTTDHGTHVAGIIAAERSNDLGIKGVCNKALIMTLRVVPNGDERDKDIANAIRYAADNGAKVINMSFGKLLSPNKELIDEAVKYALSKDVLLIHAAGNDGSDINYTKFYPCATYANSEEKAPNWMEIGAVSWKKGKEHLASFSNYGAGKVEVFAPGVDITSCFPGSEYKSFNGTSMAAPMVAGLAALIRQNYPSLTAVQTKQIILKSAVVCKDKVTLPGTKKKTKLSKISVTGGIVNVYDALVLAEKVSKGEVVLP